jgi:predicted aspartyl protease
MIDLQRLGAVEKFSVEFDLSNYGDVVLAREGQLAPEKVRRARIKGVVDTGAVSLVLPATVVKQLGLPKGSRTKVRYADGRQATRDVVDDAYLEILGRHSTFQAIVDPKRQDALIGAIVLEALDLLPDCRDETLVPRDPEMMSTEIE